jgi:NAD-dependent deacetylase
MKRWKLVVLTGAGISAESGIKTFRDTDGLWEGHSIEEVATPYGWRKNPQRVLDFYNARRNQLAEVKPNAAHYGLVDLESDHDVVIITQNVDDLHERAGSTNVLHLHGELLKMRSSKNPDLILPYMADIKIGDKASDGSQLRPHIVWFGEDVPMLNEAIKHVVEADIFAVIGTSLQVYPAASLIDYTRDHVYKFILDKKIPHVTEIDRLIGIEKPAAAGIDDLKREIRELF